MIVKTEEQLHRAVAQYMKLDEFVFDLETMYTPTTEETERLALIESRRSADRTPDEDAWLDVFKLKATDPQVNEIIWIGMAGMGVSTAIACGHPKGRLLQHERKIKLPACEIYEEDDKRYWTAGGKPSMRMVEITDPAVFSPPPPQLSVSDVIEIVRPLFFSGKLIINHNIKFDLQTITKYFGEVPPYPIADTMIAAHVLDERHKDYTLGSVVKRAFDTTYDKLGKKGVQNFSFGKAARYAQQDACFTYLLWRRFRDRLQRHPDLWRLFMEYEMRCYEAFVHLELEGVEFDKEKALALRKEKEEEISLIVEKLIVDYKAPRDFNPNANAQKIDLVYRRHHGPILKRSEKTQVPSVDAEALSYVIEAKPDTPAAGAAQLLLDYAEQSKVLGTYLISQPYMADSRDRIHASYTLHGTATGRTSCRVPNIQNVPKDSDMRDMYRAPKGFLYIGGDYDQIELRKLAVESGETNMIRLFNEGIDLHAGTAALMLHKPVEEVTGDERGELGKMPNFLLSYGGTAYNLMQKTGSTEERADEVYKLYYRAYPRIQPWKDYVIREARGRARFRDGRMVTVPYVETMLGRRRRLPELLLAGSDKSERKARSAAERQAVNCFDADTEALTQRGWVKGFDLLPDDKYLTKNSETGMFEWNVAVRRWHYPDYVGPMVRLSNGGTLDVLTTPEHRWLVTEKRTKKSVMRTSEQLVSLAPKQSDFAVQLTGSYSQKWSAYTADFCALVGWVLTDGYYGTTFLGIAQTKEHRRQEIRTLLERMGLRFSVHDPGKGRSHQFKVTGPVVGQVKRLFPTKTLTFDFVLGLGDAERLALYDAMMAGDGCAAGQQHSFVAGTEERADAFQFLCVLLGKACHKLFRAYDAPKQNGSLGYWLVSIHRNTTAQTSHSERIDNYVGPVWCVTVPNSFAVFRRHGRTFVSGNTVIQGSCAEITKLAMIDWLRWQRETGFPLKLVLMVHDELGAYVPERHAEEGREALERIMTGVRVPHTGELPLKGVVKLTAKVKISERWAK